MAGNVRALGGEAVVAGIVGDDARRPARCARALARGGRRGRAGVADDGRPTTVKTRIIAHHQQVVRADREAADAVAGALERALLQARARAPCPPAAR